MKSFKKFYVALTLTFCFSIPSVYAMEKAVTSENCFVRTRDMESHEPSFPVSIALAHKFVTLKNMLTDFSPEQIQSQAIPLPVTGAILTRIIDLATCYASLNYPARQPISITDACKPLALLELAEIAQALNYMDGPRPLLMRVLAALAEKLHAQRFEPAIIPLCQRIDELLPTELQNLLNEIFLIKFQNISSLTRIVRSFRIPANFEPVVSHTGQFMLLNGIVYDVSTPNKPKKVSTFPKDHTGMFSPDDKYFVSSSGFAWTQVTHLETRRLGVIPASGRIRFMNNKILTIGSTNYSLETRLPVSNDAASDKIKDALERAHVNISDRESICQQLPQGREVAKVSASSAYLAILYIQNNDPFYPNLDPNFYLYDIQNPKKITLKWESRGEPGFMVYGNQLISGQLDPSLFAERSTKDFTVIDLSTFKYKKIAVRAEKNISRNALEDYSRANTILDFAQSVISAKILLAALDSVVIIPLPLGKTPWALTSENQAWFSPTDSDCVITKRKMPDGTWDVTLCLLPLQRLKKCSFGQLVMLLNVVKDTHLTEDPYFKDLRENLPQQAKDLYFGTQPKTHLESTRELIDYAVENDDISEFLTPDNDETK